MAAVERTSVKTARGPFVAAAAAAVLAAMSVLAGCSSSGDTATAPTPSSVPETTTTQAPTATSGTPGAVSGAATLGSGTGDEGDDDDGRDGGASARTSDGASDADEVAPNVVWSSVATEYRGENGLWVAYDCPPDGTIVGVWGTDVYTDDSSVCTAAVHAGLIDEVDGGEVVIEISEGLSEYEGSVANGVTSLPYGSWSGSFTFVGT